MKPAIAPAYVDDLFAAREYDGLAWINSIICGSNAFGLQDPEYGLPRPLFLFVEALAWFAQGSRSGVSTYFESTPLLRQEQMLAALKEQGPRGFADQYAAGMLAWRDPVQARAIDLWLDEHDQANNRFLWELAIQQRNHLERLMN